MIARCMRGPAVLDLAEDRRPAPIARPARRLHEDRRTPQ